ncbi:MAG TPA: glycosyl hydrolase, partial [Verrucomicrobiae bacterium]|nr:glycosyl hydrolase [Verrucomicrobiae bacterium]
MKSFFFIASAVVVCTTASGQKLFSTAQNSGALQNDTTWAAPVRENHPWTRWWWMGSAVDETNLARMLTEFHQAGIGGVEICPIYGAKGYEDQFINFLSPQWMQMLAFTTREAKQLGMGVDLTTGTGWPFGGPNITAQDASARARLAKYELDAGATLEHSLPKGQLQCLIAVSDKGKQLDLTDKVRDGKLNWTAPAGHWRLYALAAESPIQKVKRAAPGGEGNVVNPYSITALNHYLSRFDEAFASYHGYMPRAEFQDSFEYFGADWTPDLFAQFNKLRGYDLRTQLPALAGDGDADTVARVTQDYRETLSDLHIAWVKHWTDWAHGYGSLTREQAHGAPANLVDLYGSADIPETEIFGGIGEQNILMNKLSSSAAHLNAHRLSSSESFTWLADHYQATLAKVKNAADYLFLSGVNHIFFHGIPYSPASAPWPGWQFYAAVNFGPEGGLWHDLPFFNAYVARCESVLQSGAPANDVLLYFPIHDFWQAPGSLFMPFTVGNARRLLGPNPISGAANFLWEHGYGYDVLTDHFLQEARVQNGKIVMNGNVYRVILIPETRLMPDATLKRLIKLAHAGATILVEKAMPADVPGLGHLEKRRKQFHQEIAELKFAGD